MMPLTINEIKDILINVSTIINEPEHKNIIKTINSLPIISDFINANEHPEYYRGLLNAFYIIFTGSTGINKYPSLMNAEIISLFSLFMCLKSIEKHEQTIIQSN